MKKLFMRVLFTATVGALASGSALADATAWIVLQDGDKAHWEWNGNINLHNTDSMPTGPTDCRQNGKSGNSEDNQIHVTLGPPFKGSASRYKYGTLCHRVIDDWVTIHYGIELSGCAMWICKAQYKYGVLRLPTILHYRITPDVDFGGAQFNFYFTDASGKWCTASNCP